jgi:ketosteroid isomerase-like protein
MIMVTQSATQRLYLNPYKNILRSKIVKGFADFSKGNYQTLLKLYDNNVHQQFEGNHALAGERFNKAKVELWFQRFIRLLPSKFYIKDMIIQGGPWNTVVIMEFQDEVSPQGITPYVNNGIMKAIVKWGKATHVHIYVDTSKVENALKELAENGVSEASEKAIE